MLTKVMKRLQWSATLFLAFAFFFLLPSSLSASGSVVGTLTTPSTSVPVRNASISFALSQAGIDIGSGYNLASSPVICSTDIAGAVKGVNNPLIAPSVNPITSTGSLSGTYFVRYTYIDSDTHQTLASPSFPVTVNLPNNTFVVTAPTLHPFKAVGYDVYVGTVSGSEVRQGGVSGWTNYTLTSYNSGGGALPASNNTVCTMTFNDSIIPPYTSYYVTVITSSGNNLSGFPQSWYLSGSSVNIGSIVPVSSQNVRFQNPILSNPLSSYATQSINSPLTLNGFSITAGTFIGGIWTTPVGSNFDITPASGGRTIIYAGTGGLATDNRAVQITSNGHVRFQTGSTDEAVFASFAINAGSLTSANGSGDQAGRLTVNNTGASIITITFATNFANGHASGPACSAQNETTSNIVRATSTPTTLVLTGTTVSGDVISYQCIGFGF